MACRGIVSFVVSSCTTKKNNATTLTVIASTQTEISENNMQMAKINLSGKTCRKLASAIGLHK